MCSAGACEAGCFIGGVVYAASAANPASACQTCVPATSTTAWTNLADGTGCGGGEVCGAGACAAGCFIGGVLYGSSAPNPGNACQACAPATSTSAWTNLADGTGCAGGDVCDQGTCAAGCYIGGAFYATGAQNPASACQTCLPATSTTAWTNLGDGTACGGGQLCGAGVCRAPAWVSANQGLYGGLMYAIAVDPTSPQTAYAGGVKAGVYKTTNGGATWTALAGPFAGQFVTGIAVAPDGSAVHVAWAPPITGANGVAKSTDGGTTWVAATDAAGPFNTPHQVVVAPSSPSTVWVATDAGPVVSTDGGATYHATGAGPTQAYQVAVHPTNPMVVYAASYAGGFYGSTNGGASWTQTTTGLPVTTGGRSVAIDPLSPTTIYFGLGQYPNNGLFKSVDGGQTFSQICGNQTACPAFPNSIAVDPTSSSVVLAGGAVGGVYRSTDGGNTWSPSATPSSIFQVQGLAFDPTNHSRAWVADGNGYTTGPGVYLSTDNGATFAVRNTGITNTTVTSLVTAASGTVYVNANIASVTTDGASSWTQIATGLSNVFPVCALAVDASQKTIYDGTYYEVDGTTNGGASWSELSSLGDYAFGIVADPSTTGSVWVLGSSSVFRSTTGGASFAQLTTAPSGTPTGLALSKQTPGIAYLSLANGSLYQSTDNGASWSLAVAALNAGSRGQNVAIDPTNDQHVIAVGSNRAYVTTDGATWNTIMGFPSFEQLIAVAIDPTHPMVAYVTSYAGNVYRSADGGLTWTNASLGLPGFPAYAIAVDPGSPTTLYLGTDGGGVYRSTTSGL